MLVCLLFKVKAAEIQVCSIKFRTILAALRSSQRRLVEVFEKYFRIEDGGVDSIFFSFSPGLLMYVSGEIEQLGDRCSTELGCVCSLCIKSQFQEHWNLISQLDLE